MAEKFKSLQINTSIEVYESLNDLKDDERVLIDCARKACERAYAPYSKFMVGAAVMLADGKIIEGNNQENAAYPSGLCAERVALFAASAIHNNTPVKMIAVTCKTDTKVITTPVTPCGSCRQVIAEYEDKFNQPIRIIMTGEKGQVYACNGIDQLLPLLFNSKQLK